MQLNYDLASICFLFMFISIVDFGLCYGNTNNTDKDFDHFPIFSNNR